MFRNAFSELLRWRRDVRRFRTDPVSSDLIDELLREAMLAPSVGYSQPWRFVVVDNADRRAAIHSEFTHCHIEAAGIYDDARAAQYRALKLEGLREAPVHLGVFCDRQTSRGHGLGQQTQPQTLRDSVVCAIHTLWLGARIRGLGLGWISILRPGIVSQILDVPAAWDLVAYLVVGWPGGIADRPELEARNWEHRADAASAITRR